jgi:uncharacterized BrkB/YihY/UPF0761 family membrane protein
MFWLWLIVALLIIAIGSYVLGKLDENEDLKVAMFWIIFFGSLVWPAILVAAMIVGPFWGLYFLGARARKKKEKSADNK